MASSHLKLVGEPPETAQRSPQTLIRVEGVSMPRWFDKRPQRSQARTVDGLLRVLGVDFFTGMAGNVAGIDARLTPDSAGLDLGGFLREAHGFQGHAEVEIFSNRWWTRPMAEVLRTCIERHRSVV